MIKSAPTSIARPTHDDGGGHTGWHATARFHSAGHPAIRSYEPVENWYWCYVDQFAFELEGAPPAPSHP